MGYEKFPGITVDIFNEFSRETFLGNYYLGRHSRNKQIKKYEVRAETDLLSWWLSEENKTKKSQDIAKRDQLKDKKKLK